VAEIAIPAVVSVSTVRTIKQPGRPFGSPFGDDLFRHYFEAPGRQFKQGGLGSGVIISKTGFILTNYHVIKGVDKITVTLSDNREFEAKIIGSDPNTDIALLKIEGKNLPTLKIGNSDRLKAGDWAIAIGNPFGLTGTVTVGIISATGRAETEIADYASLIQTDAAINPGNSGGALLNIEGELIGINTAIYSRSGGYMGIGFAIPVNLANKVMTDLKTKGHVVRGWLGVYIQPITDELKTQFNLATKAGALISDVIEGSPAEKAGIKRGDIISTFNGKVIDSFKALRSLVGQTEVGAKIEVELQRKNKKRKLTVTIAALPQDDQTAIKPTREKLGLTVENIDRATKEKYGLNSREGIVITGIIPGSPAYQSGLQQGDVILEMNYQPIKSTKSFYKAIRSASSGSKVLLIIRRQGHTQFTVLEIE